MVLGTGSHVGKSLTVAALWHRFGRIGLRPCICSRQCDSLADANTCNWTGLGGTFARVTNLDSIFGFFYLMFHAACAEPGR